MNFGHRAYRLNNFLLKVGKKINGLETNSKDEYYVKMVVTERNDKLVKSSNFYLSFVIKFVNFIYWLDVRLKIEGDGHLILIVKKV